MKRRQANFLMVVIVVTVVMVIGFGLDSVKLFKAIGENVKDKKILAAFDKDVYKKTSYTFAERTLVSKEQIKDYQSYVDTSFIALSGRWEMYQYLLAYLKLPEADRAYEKEFQKSVIERMGSDSTSLESLLQIEKEKYTLMTVLENSVDDAEMDLILRDIESTREKLAGMKNNSPGWKYVIDATTKDKTMCRFVYVAPEEAPYELRMAAGTFK